MNLKKTISSIVTLGFSALLLSGCAAPQTAVTELVTIGYVGGMCVEGQTCESYYTIYTDGSTSEGVKIDVAELKTAIEMSKINKLEEAAEDEVFCPSFADAQDQTLQVPAWSDTIYTTCRLKGGVSDPLAIAAEAAVDVFRGGTLEP